MTNESDKIVLNKLIKLNKGHWRFPINKVLSWPKIANKQNSSKNHSLDIREGLKKMVEFSTEGGVSTERAIF